MGLVEGSLKVPHWYAFANADGLKSEMWLVAYEATKKGWWRKNGLSHSTFITEHPFFDDIFAKDVEFYDTKRKARKKTRPTFTKTTLHAGSDIGSSWYPE
jgi:hypothetical protein